MVGAKPRWCGSTYEEHPLYMCTHTTYLIGLMSKYTVVFVNRLQDIVCAVVPDERAAGGRPAVRGVHHDRHWKFYGRRHRRLSLHAPVVAASHTFSRRQVSAVQARLVFLAHALHRFVCLFVCFTLSFANVCVVSVEFSGVIRVAEYNIVLGSQRFTTREYNFEWVVKMFKRWYNKIVLLIIFLF